MEPSHGENGPQPATGCEESTAGTKVQTCARPRVARLNRVKRPATRAARQHLGGVPRPSRPDGLVGRPATNRGCKRIQVLLSNSTRAADDAGAIGPGASLAAATHDQSKTGSHPRQPPGGEGARESQNWLIDREQHESRVPPHCVTIVLRFGCRHPMLVMPSSRGVRPRTTRASFPAPGRPGCRLSELAARARGQACGQVAAHGQQLDQHVHLVFQASAARGCAQNRRNSRRQVRILRPHRRIAGGQARLPKPEGEGQQQSAQTPIVIRPTRRSTVTGEPTWAGTGTASPGKGVSKASTHPLGKPPGGAPDQRGNRYGIQQRSAPPSAAVRSVQKQSWLITRSENREAQQEARWMRPRPAGKPPGLGSQKAAAETEEDRHDQHHERQARGLLGRGGRRDSARGGAAAGENRARAALGARLLEDSTTDNVNCRTTKAGQK